MERKRLKIKEGKKRECRAKKKRKEKESKFFYEMKLLWQLLWVCLFANFIKAVGPNRWSEYHIYAEKCMQM